MTRIPLFLLAAAGVTVCGPLRFKPDSIRSGDKFYQSKSTLPDSTTVVNVSNSNVTLTLAKSVATLDPLYSFWIDYVGYLAPGKRGYNYKPDTTNKSSGLFIQSLSRELSSRGIWKQNENVDYSTHEITLAPNQSIVLRGFRQSRCLLLAVRAQATTTPTTSCVDEPIDLVFGTAQTGFDTLHTLANRWTNGTGAVHPGNRQFPFATAHQRHSADGKPTKSDASAIVFDPIGPAIQLH